MKTSSKVLSHLLVGCMALVLVIPRSGSAQERMVPASSKTATATVVEITAKDYALDAPAQIPAGLTTLHLVNHGSEFHHAQLVRLPEDKSFADLVEALKAGAPPAWLSYMGGPNAVDPQGESNATSYLEPGHYALLCVIPSSDGVPHLAKGMIAPLEVVAGSEAPVAEPTADLTMDLIDYGFVITPEPIGPGFHTIRVVNKGPQPHEVVLVRLEPGKTMDDITAWVEAGNRTLKPVAELMGGVVTLDKGEHAFFSADFIPGEYVLLCFVPDAKDGKEHIEHGMVKRFTVS
jgi:uncharacterized cupredoxin-like copper-binding protein